MSGGTPVQSQIAIPQRAPDDNLPHSAYEEGCIEAERDILRHAVSFYSYGLEGRAGWFDTTGFPNRPGIGCVVTIESLNRARGYEDCARKWVATNGIPSWSRRRWQSLLRSPAHFFQELCKVQTPLTIPRGGPSRLASPDGCWRVYLTQDGDQMRPTLVIEDSTGSSIQSSLYLKPEPFQTYCCWGPLGSDVIVLRMEVPQLAAYPNYGRYVGVDLRTGFPWTQ
jgi:hypothetical protein